MSPSQSQDFVRRLDAAAARAAALFETYSPAQLTRRPQPQSWSAAECEVHLSLTAAATLPLIEAAVADLRARDLRDLGPGRPDWIGRLLRWSLEPPPRFRARTTKPFEPQQVDPLSNVLPDFLRGQARATDIARRSEGLALSRAKITSPFNSHIRYNVFAALSIFETHERRHLAQAEQAAAAAQSR
jgi:hypothetical protein